MTVLVTGVAGGLGLHVALALLARGETVIGTERPSAVPDPALRTARLERLRAHGSLSLVTAEAGEPLALLLERLPAAELRAVVHLPAATGAMLRLDDLLSLQELCGRQPASCHLVQVLARDAGFYRAGKVVAQADARAHRRPQTLLRLDEVYGPWSEPAGRCWRLLDALAAGRPVWLPDMPGRMRPLWIEDAAEAILAALDRPPVGATPLRALDLAGAAAVTPDQLLELIASIIGGPAARLGRASDPTGPEPDLAATAEALDWRPTTTLAEGVGRFAAWHRQRHGQV